MVAQFPHFRGTPLAGKLLEIAVAACVSACIALLMGNLRELPRPLGASIVQLAPADQQMARH
jgi:hypothetical protein